jgi:intein/homing endonuclease
MVISVPAKKHPEGEGQFFKTGKVINVRKGSEKQHYIINNKIRVTYEHPFFIKFANQWRYVEAQNLRFGFKILDEQQNEIEITSIELVPGVVETFNLTVKDVHSFIADTFVVHNADSESTKTVTEIAPPDWDFDFGPRGNTGHL